MSVRSPTSEEIAAPSLVSWRAEALAVNVHGTSRPAAPRTGPVTVTLSHPPSEATAAVAEFPATWRTTAATDAWSSPRANARAPALAASSSLSCVRPAAAPAKSSPSTSSTAGSATANSAVTAPRSPGAAAGP